MPSLRRSKSGSYLARGRIPADVRAEYGRRFGKSVEAKFSAPPGTKAADAKRLYAEWLAEHEARVATIRAERDGGGETLTYRRAALLAADWYRWFIARHMDEPGTDVSWGVREDIISGELHGVSRGDYENALEALLPRVGDDAETQQFLAQQRLTLNKEAHELFLRAVFDHYLAAIRRLEMYASGNYSPDAHAAKLPPPSKRETGETPWQLFEGWVAARQPAEGTVENWQYMLTNLTDRFEGRSAASLTEDDLREWLTSLIGPERSSRTVYRTWKRAGQTVFQWAVGAKKLSVNPFKEIQAPRSKRTRTRSDKHFRDGELSTILRGCLAVKDTTRPDDAAKRWVPWLLAYTGARPAEITQLRGMDVRAQDGVTIVHLTPEAGTIKNSAARDVPLHEHLIAQGFLDWVRERGGGPLFYAPRAARPQDRKKPKKSPAAQARQRLASWVRSLGVSDPELSPNHAWRHTFKVHGRRVSIPEVYLAAICGQELPTQAEGYGPPELRDKADAIARLPRYKVGAASTTEHHPAARGHPRARV
jgi:integrase